MATHVGVLDQGRWCSSARPREIYEDPVSTYVATRLGQPRINLLPADLFGPRPAGADPDRPAPRTYPVRAKAQPPPCAGWSIWATRPACT